MIRVVVAPSAVGDIHGIIDYLASVASPARCRIWSDRLWAEIDTLSQFPGAGPRRPRLGAHVRIKIVRPYIVIYEHERGSDEVRVLRVLHGRRKITRKLLAAG